MNARDRNVTNHRIVDQVPGDCTANQEAPEAHHSNKSSGPGHVCPLSGQHLENNQQIANNCQYGNEVAKENRVEGIFPMR